MPGSEKAVRFYLVGSYPLEYDPGMIECLSLRVCAEDLGDRHAVVTISSCKQSP